MYLFELDPTKHSANKWAIMCTPKDKRDTRKMWYSGQPPVYAISEARATLLRTRKIARFVAKKLRKSRGTHYTWRVVRIGYELA